MSDEKEKLLEHDYDGIQEYDNMLPRWWLQIFYVSIVFSVIYFAYYHMSGVKSAAERFDEEEQQRALMAPPKQEVPQIDEKALLAAYDDKHELEEGKKIFSTRCVSCHAEGGAGNVGPNLTDNYWLHGGKITQIAKTITEGVSDKGMLAWGQILSPKEITEVAAYVKSLRGTHPPNPKPPQGTEEKD